MDGFLKQFERDKKPERINATITAMLSVFGGMSGFVEAVRDYQQAAKPGTLKAWRPLHAILNLHAIHAASCQQRDAEERAERLKHESQRRDDLSRMSDQELEEYTNDVHRTLLRKHPQIAVGPLRALGWTVEPPAVN